MNIISGIKKLFQKKANLTEFPKNASWLLDDDFYPRWTEIKKCKPFHDMIGCKQSKKYHAEGDVWNHTKLVAKAMRDYIEKTVNLNEEDGRKRAKLLMISALFHDLGKPSTTYFDNADQDWHCKDHGAVGAKIARGLLSDEPILFREEIVWLVKNHMIFHYFDCKSPESKKQIIEKVCRGLSTAENLLALNIADSIGSLSDENTVEALENRVATVKGIAKSQFNSYWIYGGKTKECTAIIMIGLAGAGKDTFIQRTLPNAECICRDDYRELITNGKKEGKKLLLDRAGENKVTQMVEEAIKDNCLNQRSFVINQTSLTKKGRMELKEKILGYNSNYEIVFVYVEPRGGYKTCIKRRKGQIKPEVIEGMWNRLEFPDYNECDQIIIHDF